MDLRARSLELFAHFVSNLTVYYGIVGTGLGHLIPRLNAKGTYRNRFMLGWSPSFYTRWKETIDLQLGKDRQRGKHEFDED